MSAPPPSARHASPALLGTRASRPQRRRHPRQGARPLTLGTLVSRPQRRGGSRERRVAAPLGTLVSRPQRRGGSRGRRVVVPLGTLVSRPQARRHRRQGARPLPLGTLVPSQPRNPGVTQVAAPLGTLVSRPQARRHRRQGARPLPLGTLVPSQPRNHDVTQVAALLGTPMSRPHAGWRPAKWQPDYARNSACEPRSAEARAQAPRKPVIPAKAGIQGLIEMDSRFLPAFAGMTGNDGLKETIHLSFVRNQECQYGRKPESTARRRTMRRHLAEDSTDPGIIDRASPAGGG